MLRDTWADYAYHVCVYREKKKLCDLQDKDLADYWFWPTINGRNQMNALDDILSHVGDIKKAVKKYQFEILCDNGLRLENVTYEQLMKDADAELLEDYIKRLED